MGENRARVSWPFKPFYYSGFGFRTLWGFYQIPKGLHRKGFTWDCGVRKPFFHFFFTEFGETEGGHIIGRPRRKLFCEGKLWVGVYNKGLKREGSMLTSFEKLWGPF